MKKTAIYPGTFDPITYGHIDVIKKSLKIVDSLVVGVSEVGQKNYLFSIDERIQIVEQALYSDLKFKRNKIKIIKFKSLTTSLCNKYRSNIILRGLRAVSDFEYEFQLAGMNRKLNNKIETIFLMPHEKYTYTSSSIIKEVLSLGGSVSDYVPKSVLDALKNKYE